MDGGANCHVFNEEKYFSMLIRKKIEVDVALEMKTEFDGVGLVAFEAEEGKLKMLMPAYLSRREKMCTLSPMALRKHSGYKHAAHFAMESLTLQTQNNKTFRVPVYTKNNLDYVKLKIHHFNSPLLTKQQRFRTLTLDPNYQAVTNPANPKSVL